MAMQKLCWFIVIIQAQDDENLNLSSSRGNKAKGAQVFFYLEGRIGRNSNSDKEREFWATKVSK